jgi:hypothetical protein
VVVPNVVRAFTKFTFGENRYNKQMKIFYTYAFLREDGTPYYIGKGSGKRAYAKTGRPCGFPKDRSRILILKKDLTEREAFQHEEYLIFVLGRKDLGTGILNNKTNGCEGASGRIVSVEIRRKISQKQIGKRMSLTSRRRMSAAQRGNRNACGTRTEEQRRNNSNAQKGKKLSEAHKRKTSETLTGKPKTKIHRDRIGQSKKGNQYAKGRKHWVNEKGERRFQAECPGPDFQRGIVWSSQGKTRNMH